MWMRREKVGGEDAAIYLVETLACSALYNGQDEGAGPGTPLLVQSGTLSRGFPAFLVDGKHFWHSLHSIAGLSQMHR